MPRVLPAWADASGCTAKHWILQGHPEIHLHDWNPGQASSNIEPVCWCVDTESAFSRIRSQWTGVVKGPTDTSAVC
jgi:hypothetical protein